MPRETHVAEKTTPKPPKSGATAGSGRKSAKDSDETLATSAAGLLAPLSLRPPAARAATGSASRLVDRPPRELLMAATSTLTAPSGVAVCLASRLSAARLRQMQTKAAMAIIATAPTTAMDTITGSGSGRSSAAMATFGGPAGVLFSEQ